MFGLSKREQRWKAEQQAAELLCGLAAVAIKAAADIRVADVQSEANELTKLRAELAEMRASIALTTPTATRQTASNLLNPPQNLLNPK